MAISVEPERVELQTAERAVEGLVTLIRQEADKIDTDWPARFGETASRWSKRLERDIPTSLDPASRAEALECALRFANALNEVATAYDGQIPAERAVDLSTAQIIVSVGRGIKEAENIEIAQKLANILGAEMAASRPICDNGWLPMERQVGSSGQTVAPRIYFAIGISGAIQHLVGMKGAKTVVAINRDPEAPIFEIADYGIVGDLFQVVPALVDELQKAKA